MRIDEIINEDAPDIDYYNRKGTGKPNYMNHGNPGIMSMSDDELEALSNTFMKHYDNAINKGADDLDQGNIHSQNLDYMLKHGEVWDELMLYLQGKLDNNPSWRTEIPPKEYNLKYNVDDPREPRLQKPNSKTNPSNAYRYIGKRPPKEPV